MDNDNLNQREIEILETVIHQFILTGDAVGSRTLSKSGKHKLSAATIRNVMADLEEKGYLNHPHTSAGRVPTTKGYRHFVDNLLGISELSDKQKSLIKDNLGNFTGDIDLILERTAGVLAKISYQLGVILTPKFERGVLIHLDLIKLSTEKFMVVLNIKDGIAKTVILEIEHEISNAMHEKVTHLLNERLTGLTIREIQMHIGDRLKDVDDGGSGMIRLFIESADRIFHFNRYGDIKYTGASNILSRPEFSDIMKVSALIELIEDKNIIIHMMEQRNIPSGLHVTIGDENEEKPIQDCSIITAPYTVGDIEGILGVIGPMRMSYDYVIPIVDFTAKYITSKFQEKSK
jgi:heat-inducible transcriptional repressor